MVAWLVIMQNINGSIFFFWSPLEMETQAETAWYTTMQNFWESFPDGSRQKNIGKQPFLYCESHHVHTGDPCGRHGEHKQAEPVTILWKSHAGRSRQACSCPVSSLKAAAGWSAHAVLRATPTTGHFLRYAVPNFITRIFLSSCISEWHGFLTSSPSIKESSFNSFTSKNAHIFLL